MKKLTFLVIFTISLFIGPCFSQDQEEQNGDELNRVTLSSKETKEYMQIFESAWKKIKKMPKGTTWSFDNIIRTSGKIINDGVAGYKIYILTIDRRAYFDNGTIVSSIKFEVYANDSKKQILFPLEVIDFYYSHDLDKGIVLYLVKNFYDDSAFHEKSSKEIKEKIKEFMRNIDKLFI